MARINPDPYAGGHLFALVNRVTGLLNSEEEVTATVRALEEDGVLPDDIDLFTGEEGARRLDLFGREHGRAVRLLRMLETVVGDERETNQRIDEALRRGATLLCVKVHVEHYPAGWSAGTVRFKDSLQRYWRGDLKNEEKARALRVLKALHAREVHFWGPLAFEDVHSA